MGTVAMIGQLALPKNFRAIVSMTNVAISKPAMGVATA